MKNNRELIVPRVFGISVVGRAMEPIVADGQMAFVNPERTSPSVGEIVVVSFDGETPDGLRTRVRPAFLGYWTIRDGFAYLRYANHAFDPVRLDSFCGWKVEGTVIAFGTGPRGVPLIDLLEPTLDSRPLNCFVKLSSRTTTALTQAGIVSVGELLARSRRDLATLKLVGPLTLSEIVDAVHGAGLKLQDDEWHGREVKYQRGRGPRQSSSRDAPRDSHRPATKIRN